MKVYGYVRVSSDVQNCANQHYEIETFCKKNHLLIDKWDEKYQLLLSANQRCL